MRLDHFNIAAPLELIEACRDFYVNVLGFEEGFRPEFMRRGYWLYAEEVPAIHLVESGSHQPGNGYVDHIAFRCKGLAAVVARLEANSVPYRRSTIAELGMTQLFFADPAGTGLELNFLSES